MWTCAVRCCVRSSNCFVDATMDILPIGWSTSGGYTSGRSARCWSCRRERAHTPCAVPPATSLRRSTRPTYYLCRSPRGRHRRPRICSEASLRRDRRRSIPPNLRQPRQRLNAVVVTECGFDSQLVT